MSNTPCDVIRQLTIITLVLAVSITNHVHAEKADQDKPIILEAEKVSVNDVQQV